MRTWTVSLALVLTLGAACAQTEQAAQQQPAVQPRAVQQAVQQAEQPPAAPAPAYRYQGQPIALEAACSDAEIGEFGLTCSEEDPCPIYVELTSIDGADGKVLLAGNFHTETATLWSLLLASEDEGRTWTEGEKRIRGVSLDQVQLADATTGFVSGRIAGTLARDPFLLRTTDGGKTWKRLPLFEEGAVGLIEGFHFDTPAQGRAAVDRGRPGAGRYAILETATAGDAWTTRETGATRRQTPSATGAGAWRISTEAATKSYRIERRTSEGWQKAAAFAVHAGTCHPLPPPAPVQPPPDR